MRRFINRRWPLALVIVLALGAGGVYVACGRHMPPASKQASKAKVVYRCPMHPGYTSEKPGECPICGMKLVPVQKEQQAAQTPTAVTLCPKRTKKRLRLSRFPFYPTALLVRAPLFSPLTADH